MLQGFQPDYKIFHIFLLHFEGDLLLADDGKWFLLTEVRHLADWPTLRAVKHLTTKAVANDFMKEVVL